MTKRISELGLFAAIAIIFGYIEAILPPIVPYPGVKIGLANLCILFVLERYTFRDAAIVSLIRIVLVGAMFGNWFAIFYSLAGAALSMTAMVLLKKTHQFSLIGISVVGGVCHNIGQLLIAMVIVENLSLLYYAPVLILAGVIAGLAIGAVTSETLKRLPR